VSLVIERVALDDPVATALVEELFDDLNVRYGEEDDGGVGWRAEVTPEKVAPPDGAFLVAWVDGEPVGCGALKRLGADVGEIKRMYVAKRGRRRGVARAMLTRLEDEARALGYRALQLETGEVQQEAVALYASAGWTRIPSYGRYQTDPRSICFEKSLRDG
jgi:GNAT superfamily N-acetyltransferase